MGGMSLRLIGTCANVPHDVADDLNSNRISVCSILSLVMHARAFKLMIMIHRDEWEQRWRLFMQRRSTPVPAKLPVVAGVPFDPYGMFLQVQRLGGLRQVVYNKNMHSIVRAAGHLREEMRGEPEKG